MPAGSIVKLKIGNGKAFAILALLFCASLALAFLLSFFLSSARTFAFSASPKSAPPASIAYPHLPPGMESNLAAALEPDSRGVSPATTAPLPDAFADRAALSPLTSAASAPVPAKNNSSNFPSPLTANLPSAATNTPRPLATPASAATVLQIETRARLAARERNRRSGQSVLPDIASVFSYQDTLLVGWSGVYQSEQATLYSQSTGRTFHARIGTELYDAVVTALTVAGLTVRDRQNKSHMLVWSPYPMTTQSSSNTAAVGAAQPGASSFPSSSTPNSLPPSQPVGGVDVGTLQRAVRDRYSRP